MSEGFDRGLELRTHISDDAWLLLALHNVTTAEPAADELVVAVEAAPLKPSDLALLFGELSPEGTAKLRERVMRDLKTIFASTYTHTISLTEALNPAMAVAYARKATGENISSIPAGTKVQGAAHG